MRKYAILLVMIFFNNVFSFTSLKDSSFTAFSLKDFNGKNYSIEKTAGKKVTFIIFWATWSRDSGIMMNLLQEFYEKYQTKGLQVISVCVEQENVNDSLITVIKNRLEQYQVTYLNLLDDKLRIFRDLNIVAVPTVFVLDSLKKVDTEIAGYSVSSKRQIVDVIKRYFEPNTTVITTSKKYQPLKEAARYYNMALMDFKKGKLDKANEYALKAMSYDSLYDMPYHLLAELCIENERWDDASQWISQAIHCDSLLLSHHAMKYFLDYCNKKNRDAKDSLTNILYKDSTNIMAMVYYAFILGSEGDQEKCNQYLLKAEGLDSTEVRIYQTRMKINKMFGNQHSISADSLRIRSIRNH